MKNLALAIVVLLSFVSMSFAQTAIPAASEAAVPAAPAVVTPTVVTGKVDSVVMADPEKGTRSLLVIVNERAEKVTFFVPPKTVITDAEGQVVPLGAIANGANVEVAFVPAKIGGQKTVAIKVLK